MFELKRMSQEAVLKALDKADRYRLLNEPAEAESICLDVIEVDPNNQPALVILILAITDQFGHQGCTVDNVRATDIIPRLKDDYGRAYYAGVICERRAKAVIEQGTGGAVGYQFLREAMEHYERAEALRPPGNDEAILRWNTCARILNRNPGLRPALPEENAEPYLE